MTATLTNTTGRVLTGGLTQQVVLYDGSGRVSAATPALRTTCPPASPAAAMSYREEWTGVPAIGKGHARRFWQIILAIRCSPDMARMPTMTADLTPPDAQDVLVGAEQRTLIRGLRVRVPRGPLA